MKLVTPLGALNFLVLQWFGVRLARVMQREYIARRPVRAGQLLSTDDVESRVVQVGWRLLRWVWPLTGWWSDFRWIHRRKVELRVVTPPNARRLPPS